MNIAAILEAQAARCGDRPAIVERGRAISFAALDRAVASAAAELADAGLAAGMRALVFAPMSAVLYTAMIALFRLRVTAVFVDPSAGRARLDACVVRSRPDAFVAVPRAHWLRAWSPAIRAIPLKAAIGGWLPGAPAIGRRVRHRHRSVEACDPATPAIVTFTSGSTGLPKAAVRTHGFLLAQHRALVESLGLAPGEVDLCTLPIFLLANLASGVTSVIPDADLRAPGSIDPAPVLAQIRAHAPSRTVASPAFLGRLAAVARLDSFRRIFTGGAPVFPNTLDAIAAAAPHSAVVAVYGSTEAEPIADFDRRDITADDRASMTAGGGLLAGRPVPCIQLRILPDRWGTPIGPMDGEALEREALPTGTAGEIVVAGHHVLHGYLDGEGDSETKIHAGSVIWHRTGDAGRLDPAGRLWLLGRCSAKAVDEHGVLYPLAVECAASEIPGVVRTAFVLHRGRRILAAEIAGEPAALRGSLMRQLSWARLAEVVLVDRIPVDRRHNAKVEYPALLRLLDRR